MMFHRGRIAFTRALCLLALFAGVASHAAPPITDSYDLSVDHGVMASCGDFDIIVDGTGSAQVTTYFDRLGNPIRVTMHGLYSGTLTNSGSGFFLVDSPSVANISVDLAAQTEMHVGPYFSVTVPGVGNVFFDAGRLVYDGSGLPIFIAGQQHAPAETVAILCNALK